VPSGVCAKRLLVLAELPVEPRLDSCERVLGVRAFGPDLDMRPGFRFEPLQNAGATRAGVIVTPGDADCGIVLEHGLGHHRCGPDVEVQSILDLDGPLGNIDGSRRRLIRS
jgi:hypothetical protein